MAKDRVIRNPEPAADQLASVIYLFLRKAERLRIGKIQRRREVDNQIVTEPILCQRRAVAVCDLPTWSGNIENIGACQLLRLERRDNRLLFGERAWSRRRRRRWH